MEQEQQRLGKIITAIEAEVEAKLHRRAEDKHTEFGNNDRRESTVITSTMSRASTYLPRTKNTAIIVSISVLLLAALVVLLVLMLRAP